MLQAQGGAGTSRQVLAAGFSRRTMDLMVRRRELVRVRRDVVVLAEALADLTPWEKQTLLARAVGRSLAATVPFATPASSGGAGPAAASSTSVEPDSSPQPPATGVHAVSHESALMIHGLPYYGEDGLIHLVRTDGRRGRRDDTIWVHSPVGEDWVVDVDGVRVMRPVLAALQVAALYGVEAGLVALDGVLHEAQQRDRDEVPGRPQAGPLADHHRVRRRREVRPPGGPHRREGPRGPDPQPGLRGGPAQVGRPRSPTSRPSADHGRHRPGRGPGRRNRLS